MSRGGSGPGADHGATASLLVGVARALPGLPVRGPRGVCSAAAGGAPPWGGDGSVARPGRLPRRGERRRPGLGRGRRTRSRSPTGRSGRRGSCRVPPRSGRPLRAGLRAAPDSLRGSLRCRPVRVRDRLPGRAASLYAGVLLALGARPSTHCWCLDGRTVRPARQSLDRPSAFRSRLGAFDMPSRSPIHRAEYLGGLPIPPVIQRPALLSRGGRGPPAAGRAASEAAPRRIVTSRPPPPAPCGRSLDC